MAKKPTKRPTSPDPGVPRHVVLAGIVVGLLLIFLGVGFLCFGRSSLLSSLMTCVGFGLLLASFGSKASGSRAGWTATGSGSLAIVSLHDDQPILGGKSISCATFPAITPAAARSSIIEVHAGRFPRGVAFQLAFLIAVPALRNELVDSLRSLSKACYQKLIMSPC